MAQIIADAGHLDVIRVLEAHDLSAAGARDQALAQADGVNTLVPMASGLQTS